MINGILTLLRGASLLLFGIYLSAAFAGIRLHKKNNLILLALSAVCGILQLLMYQLLGENPVWKLYPLITHLPAILFLILYYKKTAATAVVSLFTAYLCCQPAKWFGVLTLSLTGSTEAEAIVRILLLLLIAIIVLRFFVPYLSEIFNKDTRSICVFGIIPGVYYLFDYSMVVYTDFWLDNNRIAVEFLPFFLCVVFLIFCFVFYKEYEQKADAERKEQIVRIATEQQAKELEAVRRSEEEIRLLRHDLRLFLAALSVCIDSGDTKKAHEMISEYTDLIDGTKTTRFCLSDTINYVLSDFDAKCQAAGIPFLHTVELSEIRVDEILFASILSNALDNALNAQAALSPEKQYVKLLLKNSDGRLLLSVKNEVETPPVFVDGLPVSGKNGHGYGTHSICYLSERLGGNCQFSVQGGTFVTRVIL